MKSIMKTMVIFIALMAIIIPSAFASGVTVWGGSNDKSKTQGCEGAVAEGGSYLWQSDDEDSPIYLKDGMKNGIFKVATGLKAYSEVPEGSAGYAYVDWNTKGETKKFERTVPFTWDILGIPLYKDTYNIKLEYNGHVQTGVTKISDDGAMYAKAKISTFGMVDDHYEKKCGFANKLIGKAEIESEIGKPEHSQGPTVPENPQDSIECCGENDGVGTAYAIADGLASFDIIKVGDPTCPTGNTEIKEIYGKVRGKTDVENINNENVDYECLGSSNIVPTGCAYGKAEIMAKAFADDNNAFAKSELKTVGIAGKAPTSVSPTKGPNIPLTEVNELADGWSAAGSWAGVNPYNFQKVSQFNGVQAPNENAASFASGALNGKQQAYAFNDRAFGLNKVVATGDADLGSNDPQSMDAFVGMFSSSSTERSTWYDSHRLVSENNIQQTSLTGDVPPAKPNVNAVARDNEVGTIVESRMDINPTLDPNKPGSTFVASGSHQLTPIGFLTGNIGTYVDSSYLEKNQFGNPVYSVNTNNYVWTLGPKQTLAGVADDAGVTEDLVNIHGKSSGTPGDYTTDINAKYYFGWIAGNDPNYNNIWNPAQPTVTFAHVGNSGARGVWGPALIFQGDWAAGRLENSAFSTYNFGTGS